MAVAREGGAVELVSPQDRWLVLGAVPGVRGREVDALAWVCGDRAPPAATVVGAPPPPWRTDKRWRLCDPVAVVGAGERGRHGR